MRGHQRSSVHQQHGAEVLALASEVVGRILEMRERAFQQRETVGERMRTPPHAGKLFSCPPRNDSTDAVARSSFLMFGRPLRSAAVEFCATELINTGFIGEMRSVCYSVSDKCAGRRADGIEGGRSASMTSRATLLSRMR